MTNINCSADCIYQKDGKCAYDITSSKAVTFNSSCAYFSPKKK